MKFLILLLSLSLMHSNVQAQTIGFENVACLQGVNNVVNCHGVSGDKWSMDCDLHFKVRLKDGSKEKRVLVSRSSQWGLKGYVVVGTLVIMTAGFLAKEFNYAADDKNQEQLAGIQKNIDLLNQIPRCEDFQGELAPAPDRRAE
jgi:hypothetical protein